MTVAGVDLLMRLIAALALIVQNGGHDRPPIGVRPLC